MKAPAHILAVLLFTACAGSGTSERPIVQDTAGTAANNENLRRLAVEDSLRDGYHMSTNNINNAVGMNLAKYAPAGDAFETAGFPLTLYASDIYHAQNRGSLLNALILYATIYNDPTVSDIPLGSVLTTLGISSADGAWLTGIADQTLAVPEPASLTVVAIGLTTVLARRPRRN